MVEIIPKPPERLPLWQNILFYLSIFLLVGAVLGYFLLDNFHEKASLELEKLEDILTREKTPEELKLEKEIREFKRKIDNFSELFAKHQYSSNFFKVLESLSHPKVQFTSLALSLEESEATLSGQTDSFQTVGQQLTIFKNAKELQEVNLSSLALGKEGEIQFVFELSFDPQILK